MKSLYLETSVISYLVSRPSRDMVVASHQRMTHDWWDERRTHYETFISQLVLDEIGRGDSEIASQRLAIVAGQPLLAPTPETVSLVQSLIHRHALPAAATDDAFHVALAATSGMDFLLTWNCRHLANANLLDRIYETIRLHGLHPPIICTPEQLIGGIDAD